MATALTLDVLTANIKNDKGGADVGKYILNDFFKRNQPDVVLIQENPWKENNIEIHVDAIGKNYYGRYGTQGTAVLFRKTSSRKLDCIEVLRPSNDWQERATCALFKAKRNLTQNSDLFMISWHGENKVDADKKKGTFQELLHFVNDLHTDDYRRRSRPVPVVLGGDFNLNSDSEDTKAEISANPVQLVDCLDLPEYRPSSIDYFIVTEDIQVYKRRAYAIRYKMDPKGECFKHAPVLTSLTFPEIKIETADDVGGALAADFGRLMRLSSSRPDNQ